MEEIIPNSSDAVSQESKITFQSPVGTRDILPEEQKYWQFIFNKIEETAKIFGFQKIFVPMFESTTLFDRCVGEDTDISKDLYFIQTKETLKNPTKNPLAKDLLSLRPEFTAGIARSYIEHGMQTLPQPVKLWTNGSVFRHEKPQKNRYRELWQADFEILGDNSPKADAWIIYAVWYLLKKIGLKNIEIQINSLGNAACQNIYQKKLSAYFQPHIQKLCSDCQRRIETNVLRILDCKEENCSRLKSNAPKTVDHLDDKSKDFFMAVLSLLDCFDISYNLNPFIVRGLDYYTDTIFEVIAVDSEDKVNTGGQHLLAIGGGGRYNGLIEKIGGASTAGVGVGLGLDRLVSEIKKQDIQVFHPKHTEIFVAGVGARAAEKTRGLVIKLLEAGFATEFSPDKNSFSTQLKVADKLSVIYTVIIGEKEARDNSCIIRDMKSGIQEDVNCDELISILTERLR